MNFVGKIVGRLAFRAFLCCFQKSKASNGGALQQHRASQDVMFAGSSPVRSAIIIPTYLGFVGFFLGQIVLYLCFILVCGPCSY